MGRWKKLHVCTYSDAKFSELSDPQPCGKYLWIYLLTGPHSTSLPVLIAIGEAAMAEALNWPLKGFREAFREVSGKGMAKADWKARVVWIPNGARYNPPESPNVIKAWRKAWDEIPQCVLKDQALTSLFEYVKTLSKAFQEVFREDFQKDLPKPVAVAVAVAVEEAEEEKSARAPELKTKKSAAADDNAMTTPVKKTTKPAFPPGLIRFWEEFPSKGRNRSSRQECLKVWNAQGMEEKSATILFRLEAWKQCAQWLDQNGKFVPAAHRWLQHGKWRDAPADDDANPYDPLNPYSDPNPEAADAIFAMEDDDG